jgi:hypothetical protein
MKRLLIILLVIIVLAGAGFFVMKYTKLFKHAHPPTIDRSQIRVEIINCSGIDKAGTRTQELLRAAGFDVYEVLSGRRMIDKTTIIERINPKLDNAQAVKEVLVYSKKPRVIPLNILTKKIYPEVQKDIDSLLYIEVTVVLGKDCESFLPKVNVLY